jgi:hypothetical protein
MARPLRIEFPGALMTNHYHLLVETPEANLSRGMRRLNGQYSQSFNRRHERVGHLLQGRFTGILVERESHLLELAGSPWTNLRGAVLGSEEFVGRLAGRLDQKAPEREFPRKERLVHREPLEAVFPPAVTASRALRNHRIRELTQSDRYTAAEIGRHLGLHYSTVKPDRRGEVGLPGRGMSRFKI